jgi:hypothetical protein
VKEEGRRKKKKEEKEREGKGRRRRRKKEKKKEGGGGGEGERGRKPRWRVGGGASAIFSACPSRRCPRCHRTGYEHEQGISTHSLLVGLRAIVLIDLRAVVMSAFVPLCLSAFVPFVIVGLRVVVFCRFWKSPRAGEVLLKF